MKRVTLALDPLDPDSVSQHDVDDIRVFLMERFVEFPKNAKIYINSVSIDNDVTPSNNREIELLGELEGPFFIVCYPAGIDPVTWIIIAAVAISLALTAYSLLTIPNVSSKNQQAPSPTNSLSDRTNQARPKGRIPDIVGTVRSTPDLIQQPYRIFDANSVEKELAYMCISRGELDITADDIQDGDTPISQIDGESIEVYGPFTSPNSGDTPQLTVGDSIGIGVITIVKSNSVNGQTLQPPNYKKLGVECADIYFQYDAPGPQGFIKLNSGSDFDFTKYFEAGDVIDVVTETYTDGSFHANLTGTYTIDTVDNNDITIANPNSVNTNWATLNSFSGHHTIIHSGPIIDARRATVDIGPFILNNADLTGIINNFVMLNGSYKTDGTTNLPFPIDVEVDIQFLDENLNPVGGVVTWSYTLPSSAVDKSQKALSALAPMAGRASVTARRITLGDYTYQGTVADTVQWRDCYGTAPVISTDFGNVTTIQTLTLATPASLGVKERKINLLCTRKFPVRIGSTSTFGATAATNQADAIICGLALDPFVGNRDISEIDVDNIYDTVAALIAYFDISEAGEFCYTFDSTQLTWQDTVAAIATAICCNAYRQGQILKLNFERQNSDSAILFNGCNIIPDTQNISPQWGTLDDADGVELTYVDPADESVITFYVPEDQSATKPQTVETVGVRNNKQAYLLAYRAYNKLLYQNTSQEFDATREADLVVRGDRVRVADTTRSNTQDGDILSQNVLVVELSQPFEYTALAHTIFLQLYDGTVQAIAIASADASPALFITLASPPLLPLVTDDDSYAKTTYEIASNTSPRTQAFLIDTKEPQDRAIVHVTAYNYDDRYYTNDLDFKLGLLARDGTLIRAADGSVIKTEP